MKKFKFIFLLSILFCGLISFSSCEKDEPGKGLSSIGESSAVVSLNGGEFKIGYKVGGTPYRLMTIKVSSNEISFGKNPEYVVSSPEIAALGININSFDEIPEKKYTNSSLSFLSKATLQNTGGYLVRLSSRRPGSSEMIQWVIKLMVSGLNDSSCTIKYIVYCDKLGLSLAYGNEIPNDDNPGGNTGGNGDNPGGNTGGNGDNPGGNTGGNGDNPGGNTGGNGDNPGGNTGGEDPAKNFVLQGEGKDIILPDGQYAHFSLESVKIGTPATGTLFSMRNEYPNLSVNSFYASGQTTTPSIASVGSVGSINEIPYYYYSSPAFSFDRSAVIKDGGYIIKFEKYDTYTYQFTQWVIALFVRETGNHNITFSYRLYTVKK